MTLQIPDGYALTTFHFQCSESSHACVTSIGTSWAAARTITQHANAMEVQIHNGLFMPCTPAQMADTWSLAQVSALGRRAGLLYSATVGSTVVGASASDVGPINTSLKVGKRTGVAGRKYRGIMMFPPFHLIESTDVDSGGNIDPARVAGITTLFSNWYASLAPNLLTPFLLHSDATAPTPITEFVIGNQVGTIGRRIRT